jgi:hypothetical protein
MNTKERRTARIKLEVQRKIQASQQRENVRMHKRMTGLGGALGYGPLFEQLGYHRELTPDPIGLYFPAASPYRKTEW